MEIVSLNERAHYADAAALWVWELWKDRSGKTLEQIRVQLLGEPHCPDTLLAVEAEEPVGALASSRFDHPRLGPQLLFVNSLFVVPTARRRGIASALLVRALARAALTDPTLYVYTDIPAWYQARGFT